VNGDGIHRAERAIRGGSLAVPCLRVLPVTGVAVAMLLSPMQGRTFCATDGVAARIDELQFDLGEGPGWAAVGAARPVFIPDLRDHPDGRWPLFDDAVREVPARGLFVFPLLVNATRVGVLTLYRSAPGPLTDAAAHTATILAQVIAPELAQRILTPDPVDRANSADPNDRSEIYQATGVVMAQLELTPETAYARIQAYALTTGTTMAQVAAAVLARHLQLPDDDNGQ
jgi:hypothetical protein